MTGKLFIWPLLAFVVLAALQIFPQTGIYLMLIGAPLWTGYLLLAAFIGLAIDAFVGNVRRFWIVVPLLALTAYYSLYLHQGWTIASREAQLKENNPTQLLQFDPSKHSLVTKNASGVVNGYRVPVAYSPGNRSHQLVRRGECDALRKDSLARIQTTGVHFQPPSGRRVYLRNLCILSLPDVPRSEIVEVLVSEQEVWKRKPTIEEGVYTLVHNGRKLGEYRTASIFRYSPIPMPIIGCGLNSSGPSWDCFASLKRTRYVLDTKPDTLPNEQAEHPVAIMLGLEPYSLQELQGFNGYPTSEIALAKASGEAKRVEEDAYVTLVSMVHDPKVELPWRFGYSLAQNEERLARDGNKVVDAFLALANAEETKGKAKEVAVAVAALPDAIFRVRASEIFGRIQNGPWWDLRPALYIRAADVGESALAKYKGDLIEGRVRGWLRFAPVLAICRIGSADDELRSFLKNEFSASDPLRDDEYHQALFLALLRLNEQEYVQRELNVRSPRRKEWYREVKDSHNSQPRTLPNNCMVAKWPVASFLGKHMRGSVK